MSVNLEGLVPVRTVRFGGQVDWDDPIQIPNGFAIYCQNMQFLAESVKQRWGLRYAMQFVGVFGDPTGVDVLAVLGSPQAPTIKQQAGGALVSAASLNPNALVGNNSGSYAPIAPNTQVGLVFADNGVLYLELPAGTGNLVALPGSRIATILAKLLPLNSSMQTAKAYNRIYQAYADFMDLVTPTSSGPVLALDAATGFVSPVGQNPIAATWEPQTFYQQGDIVTPTGNPATWFRRLQDGYSGTVEPTWPANLGYYTPGDVAVYAQADDVGGAGVGTFTTEAITATGLQYVDVNSVQPFSVGDEVTVDSGANEETVIIAALQQPIHGGRTNVSAAIQANFTKTHAADVIVAEAEVPCWQEWTPGFPIFLPTPSPITSLTHTPGGGTIAAGLDVYVCLSYKNDLGESIWTTPVSFLNTSALDKLTGSFTANPASGPSMPSWLMSIMGLGTTDGFHWPPADCINVYVASVAHGAGAPTQYRLYGVAPYDAAISITSIPGSGTLLNPTTTATAAITTQQFAGESGIRNAIVLRQNTMGDLSPVDPNGVIGVSFLGATSEAANVVVSSSTQVLVAVDDITQFSIGQAVQLVAESAIPAGTYEISNMWLGLTVNPLVQTSGDQWAIASEALPAGILVFTGTGLTPTTGLPVAGSVSTPAGPCPVAVLPPGTQEGPGYSYDIVALTVSGLGVDGPFNYLSEANPASPFSTTIIEQGYDGQGNGYAVLTSVQGLQAGDSVAIANWPTTGVYAGMNGPSVLASVVPSTNTVTFPSSAGLGGSGDLVPGGLGFGATMSVVPTQPTQAVAGSGPFLLQVDDTSLPEGVNVTGNLLFVGLPPCIDLAYLPSLDRMAYVSDQFPTTLIFSEEDFMGEVDGLNDILAIEASNGSVLVGARELLNGTIVACKRSGGYQVVPTADVPANWGVSRLWGIHGPTSGRNIATGRDGSTGLDYILFVDPEAGLFKWPPTLGMGELDWLSKELSGANNQDASRMATWDRVNRAAGASIQVVVDDIAKEVKIAVPLDGATSPSHVLTMSYFNGWQDPLMLTLSGEWVANRQSRRWNIDPIPTNCMAMVQRTLEEPVDQRVNYHQLLLGTPTFLAASYAQVTAASVVVPNQPTVVPGAYYVQLAKVVGNQEIAYTPVAGPFSVSYEEVGTSGKWLINGLEAQLPGDELEDSWTLYFGTSPTNLIQKIPGIPNNITSYVLQSAGNAAFTPTGFVALQYMQPGVYDDLNGAGYLARYRPSYAKEAPSQEWPDGGRILRFVAVTGHALGAGNLEITPFTDDPNYAEDPMVISLDEGQAEIPGSAPITHFNSGMKGDSEFLTVEYSNGGVPDSWFQLVQSTLWHKPLFPTR
jgi:hypothetical protein